MHEYYVCFSFFDMETEQSLISDAFVKSEKKLVNVKYRILYLKDIVSTMLTERFKNKNQKFKFDGDNIKILNIMEIS